MVWVLRRSLEEVELTGALFDDAMEDADGGEPEFFEDAQPVDNEMHEDDSAEQESKVDRLNTPTPPEAPAPKTPEADSDLVESRKRGVKRSSSVRRSRSLPPPLKRKG